MTQEVLVLAMVTQKGREGGMSATLGDEEAPVEIVDSDGSCGTNGAGGMMVSQSSS